jgi:thiol-disulfide isomerase/thioredoxin
VRRASLAVLLGLVAVLAGCSTGTETPGLQPGPSSVDVDTPALRAQKSEAGVLPCRRARSTPPAEDALPDAVLRCLGGGPSVNLSRLRGPLVINLFAQWCGPCRTEMPYYQKLHRKGRGKVQVLGIDYLDTQPSAALDLVRRTGVTYPLLADPDGDLRADFRIRGLPGLVLVDERGRVVDVEFRVVRSYAELRGLVERRLDVRLPS